MDILIAVCRFVRRRAPLLRSASLLALALSVPAVAADVVRHPIPGSDFPIAAAVEIPAGNTVVHLSGKVPQLLNPSGAKDAQASWGDTRAQTVSVLGQIKQQLEALGLSLGDVVRMQVFLVGDPALGGRMDFDGFMAGYRQFFGTREQPNLPARSAFQVVALVNPLWRVEIEVTAVRR